MLAYIEQNNRVQVKYSEDGSNWSAANLPATTAHFGVGATSTNDQVGVSRILAYAGSSVILPGAPPIPTRLLLRFGLGPDNWSNTEEVFNQFQPGHRPTIAHLRDSVYLLAFFGGANNSAVVLRYDNSSRQFTDVTPSGLSNLRNSMLQKSPALGYHPRNQKVVLAWLRHNETAQPSPAELQVVAGNVDTAGNVTWTNVIAVNASDPSSFDSSFSANDRILSDPTLARDRNHIFLGFATTFLTTQPCCQTSPTWLRVFGSQNGISWFQADSIYNVPLQIAGFYDRLHTAGFVELAAVCKNGTMLAAFVNSPTAQAQFRHKVFRRDRGASLGPPTASGTLVPTWTEVSAFGNDAPATRRFALIAAGEPPSHIQVCW